MHDRDTRASRQRQLSTGLVLSAAFLLMATSAFAQPTFSKAFNPATIGPGSTSTLTFTVSNASGSPVRDLAFVDPLPAGLTVASPSNAASSCGGTLDASGSTITLSGGGVGASNNCVVTVSVTAGVGSYVNTSGDLTSDAGNSGPASATLTVDGGRPGFAKSFSPSSVPFGGRSTLTFTIDNSANGAQAFNMSFIDNLPPGVTVADPSNASTTCAGAAITAAGGSGSITFGTANTDPFGANVVAGATCSASVDVVGGSVGELDNVSNALLAGIFPSPIQVDVGYATARLTVIAQRLALVQSFIDDPVTAGDTVTLETTITNIDRGATATGITFANDLDATLSGLAVVSVPSNPCGTGSSISGTSVVTLAGGSLSAGESCTYQVTLQVPTSAPAGAYTNTTGTVTGTAGGQPVAGAGGSDTLVVNAVPSLTKSFLTDPVGAGGTVQMEFTLTNGSVTSSAADIAFTDNLSAFFSGVTVAALPANGFCGAGSVATQTNFSGDLTFNVIGASLDPGASCTFTVDLVIPASAPSGTFLNTTSAISATIDGSSAVGRSASDTLTVVRGPTLSKLFIDDPVLPGDTATLRFTLSLGEESTTAASAIAFTDDLAGTLAGLVATALPSAPCGGESSSITGTSNLVFSGGSLAAGDSCTFDVTVQVPAEALPGTYTNSTSNVTATVGGVAVVSEAASDDLSVAGLSFSKTFTDDPVIAGGSVTLEFTIDNTSPSADATGMFFTDNLGAMLSGAVASSLPTEPCGVGSSITGTSFLIFVGGNLTAGTSCTFAVTVDIPASAATGSYINQTSNLAATVGGSSVVLDIAADALEVANDLLFLEKEFTDDLEAALSGLASISGTLVDPCGAGSSFGGTDLLTFSGGNLAAGASCTFSVTVVVPANANPGIVATNTTSAVTGSVGGLTVSGEPASDDLLLYTLGFTKAFSAPTPAGERVDLTFTITNGSSTDTVGDIEFADDLDDMLSGLAAVDTPLSDVCGSGSVLSGTSLLQLTGGSLMPGGSCTFTVQLEVPNTAEPGIYTNITSDLGRNAVLAGPAIADLEVTDGCFVDDFNDGVVDPAWTLVGVGNANQQSVLEDSGVLALTADGATAFYGADNAGFLYQSVTGNFRIEATIDGNTMTTGGQYRKAGLMVRASLDPLDIRLIAQLVPFWENQDEVHLQFVARESFATPGRLPVARDVVGGPRVVRLAVERVGDELSVEYSYDGGATWIRPTTGLGGSITIAALPETLLVGLDMVSNNISVTSTALFDDAEICPIVGN
ncbi:MAG: hypothetical protein AAGE94_01680 [Acidobacteriota bacterium]